MTYDLKLFDLKKCSANKVYKNIRYYGIYNRILQCHKH